MSVINTHSFGRFWAVSWTITHHFGVPERFPRLTNPGVRLRVGHQHSQFWPILTHSWIITHRFGVPERFPWLLNPKVRLRVGHEHSPFWPILARFMGYCSPF